MTIESPDITSAPCGNRLTDCTRPEYCDECLPRDRRQLHDRILTRCDPAWYGLRDDPPGVFAALRRVVELCTEKQDEGVDGHFVDVDTFWPSSVLAAIAEELNIEVTVRD